MFKYCLVLTFCLSFTSSAPSKNSTNGDATACLKEFYQVAYDGTYNCTKGFDFFSDNSTLQQKSFVTGKSCFLEVAKEECSNSQYTLLSTKYQDFLDVITKKPKNESDCDSFYYKYSSLRCEPIAYDLNNKEAAIQKRHTKINDTRVLEVIRLCNKVQACMKSNCLSEVDEAMMNAVCESVKMSNSEFRACEFLIKKESPDMSEYKCLDGSDFHDESVIAQIEKYTVKKECTKEIMKDICGEKAINDFDKYADMTADYTAKAAKMQMAMNAVMMSNGPQNKDFDD